MIDFIRSTTPTARKNHTCDYCCIPIMKSEKYQRSLLRDDGGMIYEWKCHDKCSRIASELFDSGYIDGCDGLGSEEFQESVRDLFSEFGLEEIGVTSFDKMVDYLLKLFETNSLKQNRPNGYCDGYVLVPKGGLSDGYRERT